MTVFEGGSFVVVVVVVCWTAANNSLLHTSTRFHAHVSEQGLDDVSVFVKVDEVEARHALRLAARCLFWFPLPLVPR